MVYFRLRYQTGTACVVQGVGGNAVSLTDFCGMELPALEV